MIRFICKVGIIIIHKAVALRLATAFFVFVVGCFFMLSGVCVTAFSCPFG